MSYRKTDHTNGLPSIHSNNRGIFGDPSLRRSLTRLDDIESTPRHVSFRAPSPTHERGRTSPYRSSSPVRTRSPPRSLSPTSQSRKLTETQDQIRVLQDELRRKESLLSTRLSQQNDASFDRQALENARGEIAALQVKVETLTSKLKDTERQADENMAHIQEYKRNLEVSKENEARQMALAESLRERLRELEAAKGSLESVKSRTEMTIQQLNEDKAHQNEKMRELESRLRNYLQERESAEVKAGSWEKRYQESMVILRSALGVDYNESVDIMKVKINELVSDNTMLKGKLCTLEESLANSELESKASRETINRLVSEVNKEQSTASKYSADIERVARDRDAFEASKREVERECEILRERLDASQRAWNATKHELEEKTRVYSSIDHELRDNTQRARSMQSRFESLLEQLGVMLQVSPSEDLIKDRIRQLQGASKDGVSTIRSLEEKIYSLNEQLKATFDHRSHSEKAARRYELEIRDLEEKLKIADRELGNAGVYRDGLRNDKEQFLRFMERLSEIMKMDRISAEIGYDMTGETLLARASQLAKMEADTLADRNTHIYNLQRKIKTMKEQLESKDLHLDLLRKKIGQLEEKVVSRSELEKDRDIETQKVRRVERTCDKYSRQLEEARMQITDLKAQLLESEKYKVDNQDLVNHCEKMEARLQQLDNIRQKQAKKITHLKDEMCIQESGGEERISKASGAIEALSSELKTTKNLLDDMAKREKQLVDLRTVVARMLGLDVNTLAVPDYEIISRMEKLIQAHHAHTMTNWTMDQTLESLEDGLHAGYPGAKIYLGEPRHIPEHRRSRTPERRSKSPEKRGRSPEKRRTRSPSPTKVDTRKY